MRVTGIVLDSVTKSPIGGAVIAAEDGRNRHSTTNPHGQFNVKTNWDPMTLTVSAPGYVTRSVPVADTTRHPVINIELAPLTAAALAARTGQAVPSSGSEAAAESNAATKLRELQALHERGVISTEEYQRSRNRIVDGL
jgi:hypothetical protein